MQSAIRAIYPPQCVACDAMTEAEHGLCGACWGQTAFISGTICDTCGCPLPGDDHGEVLQCDDCMQIARPWERGRAAFVYKDVGRKLVLALKHGDRLELAWPAAGWMAGRVADLVKPDTIIVPVPLHWSRLIRRKYNQAALLAQDLGRHLHRPVLVDGLLRIRRTAPLDGVSRQDRFATVAEVIAPHPKRGMQLVGKSVLLVDDVMTSGATLAACTEAAHKAGAAHVNVVTLARVVKDA